MGEETETLEMEASEEWETMARAWVAAFPDAKAVVSATEVEKWIGSNHDSLAADLREMPRSELVDRLLSIQQYMRPTTNPARFQRSDQWLPVYSWLESLDSGDLVKSKDISDWLEANPVVKQQLSSRHSRYHLTHYVKKCHLKILKRKEKKGLIRLSRATALEVHKEFASPDPITNIPKDTDLYRAKHKEAKRRYEILVELEKRLAPHFPSPNT